MEEMTQNHNQTFTESRFYEASFVYGLQNIYVDHSSWHLGFTPVLRFSCLEVHVDYHQLFPYSNIKVYFRRVCKKKGQTYA